jgi:hypothetical protein
VQTVIRTSSRQTHRHRTTTRRRSRNTDIGLLDGSRQMHKNKTAGEEQTDEKTQGCSRGADRHSDTRLVEGGRETHRHLDARGKQTDTQIRDARGEQTDTQTRDRQGGGADTGALVKSRQAQDRKKRADRHADKGPLEGGN